MADMFKWLNTLKNLRFKQIYYRFFYTIRNNVFHKEFTKKLQTPPIPLIWNGGLFYENSFLHKNGFIFLNIEHTNNSIDWNLSIYGKLWTYNLNYFDFLNQENIEFDDGLRLIEEYLKNDAILKDGKEPYPISLRGINWIKFLSKNNVTDNKINQVLYNHYQILINNLEYHLLGNHLLENGFSLLFGSYFFRDEIFYNKAKKILLEELEEQVLNDGAHFELSPMYHQILLHRLLDCINLVNGNLWKQKELLMFLKEKALKMLSWLQTVTYKNGNIPMVNDSAYGIAPTSEQLFIYAKNLDLKWEKSKLSDSGYRKVEKKHYELFMDVGNVGPKYQPGHAHSDTFNFELYVNERPIIVDTGVSTYEKNHQRQLERSTASHNTVKIGDYEQTEVWGGFRVAKRAEITKLKETDRVVEATHDGYIKLGIFHSRKFSSKRNAIVIEDKLSEYNKNETRAFLHFHPSIDKVERNENTIKLVNENIIIKFSKEAIKINILDYDYACGFNKKSKAKKIEVHFKSSLETQIQF